jgi:hypothetical protein
MPDFINGLGDVLSTQFNVGENKISTLDVVTDGHTRKYGLLGDFANKFDQSAERRYLQEGFFKNDNYNMHPKQLEVLMQEPDITVLIKKRAFSSLSENFRQDLMDSDDRIFLKTTKILFQNKAKQISNFEKLSKIGKIATEFGRVDSYLLPLIFSATDSLAAISESFGESAASDFGKLKNIVDLVRKATNLSKDNIFTTWITNTQDSFKTEFAEGTGVLELTTVSSINTTASIAFGGGGCSLNISNPYNFMRITNLDIEQAIADSLNVIYNNKFFQLGSSVLQDSLNLNKRKLEFARRNRNVHPIIFEVNPDAFLGKRVRAIIDSIGFEINFGGDIFSEFTGSGEIDASAKFGSDELGAQGLNDTEISLFNTIISTIFQMMNLETNSKSQLKDFNMQTNSLRKKMYLHYGKKQVIQPMDVIHIYASSKTRIDNKILGGLQDSFSSLQFTQTLNNVAGSLKESFDLLGNSSVEKAIFVGNDFPTWLWAAFRNQFVSDKNGIQIFEGLVSTADSSFSASNGSYITSISAKDNTDYFNHGIVNFKPSVDVFNGPLYDPLTPFDIKFDSVDGSNRSLDDNGLPELLDENKILFESAFIKYKNGLYSGRKPTQKNYIQDAERTKNNNITRFFYDPDGLVYKWKEGIGTLVLFGDSFSDKQNSVESVPAITSDPFAGQDVMNALSLLITGEPYNFATFYKTASQFDSFGRDPQTGQDPSVSYFKNLQSDLKQRNFLYGNFIPFKKLVMDEESYKNVLNNQLNVQAFDSQLQSLLEKRAELSDKIISLKKRDATSITNLTLEDVAANNLSIEIAQIDEQIDQKVQNIQQELNKTTNTPLKIIGDDVSFDPDISLGVGNSNDKLSSTEVRRQLRRKINFLTRKLIWKVRANEDVNLLVIDDTYDKDYDIQAFEKSFTNTELFNSDYLKVSDKITETALKLNLEVFADTQGNIQIRPPQYNRMPTSIFYRLFKLKQEKGIQLFPQFIEDLYAVQLDNTLKKIEVIEDQIRLFSSALNLGSDSSIEDFISKNLLRNAGGTRFKFLTSEDQGFSVLGNDIRKLILTDSLEIGFIKTKLENISKQSSVENVFDILSRTKLVRENFTVTKNNEATYQLGASKITKSIFSDPTLLSRVDKISSRLKSKTGQKVDLNSLFPNSGEVNNSSNNSVSNLDILRASKQIADLLQERQRTVKLAANAIKNIQEAISLNNNKDTVNKLLFPNLYQSKEIPQVFEHMLEDESYDDLGPNSGDRFILKNNQILSMVISEKAPEFTGVSVTGRFGDLFIQNNQLPQDLNVFQGGNALVSAAAIDYDLWRMYGVRLPQHIDAPFLTDPQTQCAPYAVALLTRARQQVLTGTIDIVGNEYMQPGEVIYIENEDILFYIESVRHSFTFGGKFITSLNVSYGHSPGEYIPTMLDVVGKVLYKNKDINNFSNIRQGNRFNQEPLGVIIGNSSDPEDILSGQYSDANRKSLNNIINSAISSLNIGSTVKPILEVRIYYNSENSKFSSQSPIAESLANTVNDFLLGKKNLAGDKKPDEQAVLTSFKDQIKVIAVDTKGVNQRYPSRQAYAAARYLTKVIARPLTEASAKKQAEPIDSAIYNYIVDCWITFEENS